MSHATNPQTPRTDAPVLLRSPLLPMGVAVAVIVLGMGACSKDESAPAEATEKLEEAAGPEEDGKAYESYRVAGRIESLPEQGAERPQVRLAHEEIKNFRDRQGREVGMAAMTMAFALAPGVSLDGVEQGDEVAVDFEVRWQERPSLWITKLEKR